MKGVILDMFDLYDFIHIPHKHSLFQRIDFFKGFAFTCEFPILMKFVDSKINPFTEKFQCGSGFKISRQNIPIKINFGLIALIFGVKMRSSMLIII